MGKVFAEELSDMDMDLKQQLGYHLRANHYPPVPLTMVEPCIQAIEAYNEGAYHREIELPEGVSWRGKTTAPVYAMIEAHHLEAWLDVWEEE